MRRQYDTQSVYLYSDHGFGVIHDQGASPDTDPQTDHQLFLKSFLYYVPYVTLAVMTFPAIIQATQSPLAGAAALVIGIILAWMNAGLFPVAVTCCMVVLILELFL